MTLLRLSSTAVARSRFALSPLAETLGSLKARWLRRSDPHPADPRDQAEFADWLRHRPLAAGLVALLSTTKWLPDLVAIPPVDGVDTDIDAELRLMRRHDDASVRASIEESIAASWRGHDRSWLPATELAERVAEVMAEGWQRFVRPDWPRRRAVLERDIAYRSTILANHGWQRTLTGMTRRSAWVGPDSIRFNDRDQPDQHLGDDGLIFVPYTAGSGWWLCDAAPHHALVYPARGAASPPNPTGPNALATLIGPGRATVLAQLRHPASSSQLAATLGLSLGTVSAHLAVLRESGIITGTRLGRSVLYRLTERGEGLVALFPRP